MSSASVRDSNAYGWLMLWQGGVERQAGPDTQTGPARELDIVNVAVVMAVASITEPSAVPVPQEMAQEPEGA